MSKKTLLSLLNMVLKNQPDAILNTFDLNAKETDTAKVVSTFQKTGNNELITNG